MIFLFIYKYTYRCKLIGEIDLGERTENGKIIFIISLDFPLVIFILSSKFLFHSLGSYSGTLGLLQKKEALIYLKPDAALVDEEWLKLSLPVRTEK